MVVLHRSEPTNSLEDCEISLQPNIMLITFSAVDFPLEVEPTAVGTEQDPYIKQEKDGLLDIVNFNMKNRCTIISIYFTFYLKYVYGPPCPPVLVN